MFISILRQLKIISQSRWYWWSYIISGLGLLAIALYYQHVLDDPPCIMCIQVRLWLTLLIIISIGGLLSCNAKTLIMRGVNTITHLLVVIVAMGLTERAYQILGTERGFVFGDCSFSLGLPSWLTPDVWWPWLFRVETSCGYTPEIAFGITMAEILMVLTVLLLSVSACIFIVTFVRMKPAKK